MALDKQQRGREAEMGGADLHVHHSHHSHHNHHTNTQPHSSTPTNQPEWSAPLFARESGHCHSIVAPLRFSVDLRQREHNRAVCVSLCSCSVLTACAASICCSA